MAKKNKFGLFVGVAAVAGAVAAYLKLDKEAKEKNTNVVDLSKEKVDKLIEDVKSSELANKANESLEKVKESETYNKVSGFANDLKENVSDFFSLESDDEE